MEQEKLGGADADRRCTPSTSRRPAARRRRSRTASSSSSGCSRTRTGRRASRCRRATSWSACSAAARDGYSGISANPALGAAVDRLVRHGGTAILSETPEIYGGEHLLTRRAVTPRGRRQAGRAHPLVGALLRAQRRGDGQQPVGRQQGRRADDDPREEPGRDRQERHDQPGRRRRVRAAGHGQGPGVHGHARLRPGLGDRPGRRRRQPDLLHHRPRLGLRLRALAFAQARRPTPRCGPRRKTTSTSTAATSSTAR